jgi:serine/threonine-protein kinase GIN4
MGDGGLLCDGLSCVECLAHRCCPLILSSAAKSSLPVRRHEQVAPDNRFDRMTLWIKNVESESCFVRFLDPSSMGTMLSEVVEDTRQTFAATTITPLPPLPVAPSARNTDNRSAHLPHKVLTANQIFTDRPSSSNQPLLSSVDAVENPGRVTERNLHTPQRTRRATVSTRSPEPVKSETTFSVEKSSPSKHKAKSRSHGNIMQPISSISVLELELKKRTFIISFLTT